MRGSGKRGTLSDIYFLASVGFLMVGMVLILSSFLYAQLFGALADTSAIEGNAQLEGILEDGNSFYANADKLAVAYFVGVILALVISSWLVAGNPLAMVLYFVGGVGAVLVSMLVSNMWESLTAAPIIADSLALYPFADHIMNNLAFYTGIFFFIGIVVTFVKPAIFTQNQDFEGGQF